MYSSSYKGGFVYCEAYSSMPPPLILPPSLCLSIHPSIFPCSLKAKLFLYAYILVIPIAFFRFYSSDTYEEDQCELIIIFPTFKIIFSTIQNSRLHSELTKGSLVFYSQCNKINNFLKLRAKETQKIDETPVKVNTMTSSKLTELELFISWQSKQKREM